MTIFDCSKELSNFHDEKVTLGRKERNEMRERRDNGRKRLKTGLDLANHPHPKEIHSQGSYRMWTMVQDDRCDYDIDDGLYFQSEELLDENGNGLTPSQARQRVCDALSRDQRFVKPAEVKDNCVRQEYKEGYHIDMPVYRIRTEDDVGENQKQIFELASKDNWEQSDARAVTRWFNDNIQDLNSDNREDGHQLRRLVRLTKAFARSRDNWKNRTTSGITITKLIIDAFRASPGRDDESLHETWKIVERRLNESTKVEHPINSSDLAGNHDDEVRFFQEKLTDAIETLSILEDKNCTRNEARNAWDSVFNTSYISNLPDPNDQGEKKAPFIPDEEKADTRDDGNGRYG